MTLERPASPIGVTRPPLLIVQENPSQKIILRTGSSNWVTIHRVLQCVALKFRGLFFSLNYHSLRSRESRKVSEMDIDWELVGQISVVILKFIKAVSLGEGL